MKKVIVVLVCILTLLCFTACDNDNFSKQFTGGGFYCKRKNDDTIVAVGDLSEKIDSDAIFVPCEIEGYIINKLGFSSGLGFGGNGYFHDLKSNIGNGKIKRYYAPYTITDIHLGYMLYVNSNLKVFYCGKVLDLSLLNVNNDSFEIYVPNEKYEYFTSALGPEYEGTINRANVSYRLNYDEIDTTIYYVDNYKRGEHISYMPPEPTREEYDFAGWYKEAECTTKWNFEEDVLETIENEFVETKLYAKWVVRN